MGLHSVTIYAVVRVAFEDIEADTQREAIIKAKSSIDLEGLFNDLSGQPAIKYTAYADENARYLVENAVGEDEDPDDESMKVYVDTLSNEAAYDHDLRIEDEPTHYRVHGTDFAVCGAGEPTNLIDSEEDVNCPNCVAINRDARRK